MNWRGTPLMKNVFDFAIYPMLLAEIRPRTVLEIRIWHGSQCRHWFADNLAALISKAWKAACTRFDRVKPQAEHPGVTFRQGDCSQVPDPGSSMPIYGEPVEPHPWLVVEDAHYNRWRRTFEHFHSFLTPGDYLVVEDSGR